MTVDEDRIAMCIEVLADETNGIPRSDGEYVAGVVGCPKCGNQAGFYAPLPADAEVLWPDGKAGR